jgi:hypothetical protein
MIPRIPREVCAPIANVAASIAALYNATGYEAVLVRLQELTQLL